MAGADIILSILLVGGAVALLDATAPPWSVAGLAGIWIAAS